MTYEPFNPARMKEDDGTDTDLSEEVYVRMQRYFALDQLDEAMRSAARTGSVPPDVAKAVARLAERGRQEWDAVQTLLEGTDPAATEDGL